MLTAISKNLWRIEMSINTPFNVILTEGQISVILNSLDYTLDRWEANGYQCEEDEKIINAIYEVLEGSVDKYYNKLEAAKEKQPKAEW